MCLHKYDQTNLFLSEKYSDNCLYITLRSFSFKLPRTLRGTVSNVPSDTSSCMFFAAKQTKQLYIRLITVRCCSTLTLRKCYSCFIFTVFYCSYIQTELEFEVLMSPRPKETETHSQIAKNKLLPHWITNINISIDAYTGSKVRNLYCYSASTH